MKALEDALKASEAKVSAVSVKLPPFWPNKAKLWFAQAKAQFLLRNKVCTCDHNAGKQHSGASNGHYRKPYR